MVDQSRIEIEQKIMTVLKVQDVKTAVQDERIQALEKWADSTEQESRNHNMVI